MGDRKAAAELASRNATGEPVALETNPGWVLLAVVGHGMSVVAPLVAASGILYVFGTDNPVA